MILCIVKQTQLLKRDTFQAPKSLKKMSVLTVVEKIDFSTAAEYYKILKLSFSHTVSRICVFYVLT